MESESLKDALSLCRMPSASEGLPRRELVRAYADEPFTSSGIPPESSSSLSSSRSDRGKEASLRDGVALT